MASPVLLFGTNMDVLTELSECVSACDLRVKTSSEKTNAKEWLTLHEHSLLLLPADLKRSHILELADTLWQTSPEAPCVIYNVDSKSYVDVEWAKLNGLQLLTCEEKLSEQIAKICETVSKKPKTGSDKFEIMVVEDLDSPRDIICVFIESLGYPSVVGKSSASDALKELEENPDKFSCIITDIRMPHISGVEFIDIIRHHDKLRHLPIIVLTAHGTIDILVDSLQAGASGFLAKPPKKSDVIREMSRAIRISQGKESPRLATHGEAEQIRRVIEEQGLA